MLEPELADEVLGAGLCVGSDSLEEESSEKTETSMPTASAPKEITLRKPVIAESQPVPMDRPLASA